jgi:hypothetical protein
MSSPCRQVFCLFLLLLADPGRAGVNEAPTDRPGPCSIARVEQVYPLALRYRTQMLEEIAPAPILVDATREHESLAAREWMISPLEEQGTFLTGSRSLYALKSLQR